MNRAFLALALAALLGACGDQRTSVGRRTTGPCLSDLDCAPDEVCADGLCVRVGRPGSPAPDGGGAGDGGAATDGGAADGGPVADGGPAADGGPVADGGAAADGGPVADGGPGADGGPADGGGDGGMMPRFCGPCSSDASCGSMKCVTAERTGERFCSPSCGSSSECPGSSICAFFLVNQGAYCFPQSGTCLQGSCQTSGCPADLPSCDPYSGRCYRTENRGPCQACDYSYQCGGYWDRCVSLPSGQKRCGKDCDTAHGGTCPSGYRCVELPSSNEPALRQCEPLTGDCSDCRADNPCQPGQTCDIATGQCVSNSAVRRPCRPCESNSDCGQTTNTCYQGGCMPYCDTYTPCPPGWRCATLSDPERHQSVRRCIPDINAGQSCETLLHCAPCESDEDCNGGHCLDVAGSGRCGQHCDASGIVGCPAGSACVEVDVLDFVCRPSSCP